MTDNWCVYTILIIFCLIFFRSVLAELLEDTMHSYKKCVLTIILVAVQVSCHHKVLAEGQYIYLYLSINIEYINI